MTHEPEHPEIPPPVPPEEEHHSLGEEIRHEIEVVGEEIRHEIEVVVEHVPQPVRWTISRLFKVAAISLAALVIVLVTSAVLYVMNRTEWVARELTLVVNQALASHSDVVLEMKDIRGNPFTGLRVVNPKVRFRDGTGPVLLEARAMDFKYPLWGIATGGPGPISIEVDHPVVRLERGKDGRLRLPIWKSGAKRLGTRPRELDATIVIHGGRMEAPEPPGGIEGLELVAAVSTGEETHLRIQSLRWAKGPYHSELQALEAEMTAGDSVEVRLTRLVTPDLSLHGNASWPSGKPREFRAHAEVERVRWRWLVDVFRNGAFDSPGDCALVADVQGSPSVHGSFHSTLSWNGLPADGTGSFHLEGGRWIVDPLVSHSAAGELTGRFEYDPHEWVVSGDVVHGNPVKWDAIQIRGWPEGDVRGHFRYAVNSDHKVGTLAAELGPSTLAGWQVDSARVALTLPHEGHAVFTVDTKRLGGGLHLDGESTDQGWRGTYLVHDLPLEEWPDGRKSGIRGMMNDGRGTVEGRNGGLFVTGELRGHETNWLGAHLHDWSVHELAGRLLPTPDLRARARLFDMMYLGIHFDSAAAGLALGDAVVHLDSVTAIASDTTVSLSGESRWNPHGWTVQFDRATLRSHQFEWHAEPPVMLAGDPTGVTFERLRAHDGDADIEMQGRWAGPGGFYDWTATGHHLSLARLGLPDELEFDGRADATLRVTGVPGDPRWTLDSRVSRPGYQGHHADSLSIELAGSPGTLEVRGFSFVYAGGRIESNGRVEAMSAWPDSLTPAGIVRWIGTAQSWQAEAHAHEVPLDDLRQLVPAADGWAGRVSADLTVRGRPSRPELELTARAEPISWMNQRLDAASVHATYRDERLLVTDARMTRDKVVSTASGSMALVLALEARPEVPDRPMKWSLQVPKGDLAVVPAFVPQIGAASGHFEMDAEVAGTPHAPQLTGYLRVRDGVVRPAAREEVLDHVYADFTLSESHVRLDTLAARQGAHGRVNGHGIVDIDRSGLRGYAFDFDLRQFTASEPALYAAEFDGRFHVANGPRFNGQMIPQVTGKASVRRAAILYDFTSQTEEQALAASAEPLFWTYRIDVEAKDKLKWTPREADIEFNADLTVEQTTDSLIIFGEMHSLRGTYYFLSNRFNVVNADLVFDNAKDGINPTIDASATARIGVTATGDVTASSGSEVSHQVTVLITGRAREPKVAFESDPPDWDQSKILRELTLGSFVTGPGGGVDFSQPIDTYLTQAINRTLSAELSRTFKGYLNDWALERENGGLIAGEGAVIVSVSSQPVRNVNVRYRQRLAGSRDYAAANTVEDPFQSSIEAEYRLSRFIYFSTELTKRLQTIGTTIPSSGLEDFRVNLKARWEY